MLNAQIRSVVVVAVALLGACAPHQTSAQLAEDRTAPAAGITITESLSLADAQQKAHEVGQRRGVSDVLVVFDCDNTLLAMDTDLGSDPWFTWQVGLIQSGNLTDAVAHDIPTLSQTWSMLLATQQMHPTQSDAADIIKAIQDEGFTTMVLTARSPATRSATERELARNGYDFSRAALTVPGIGSGTFLPYDLNAPQASGFTAADVTNLGLGQPQPVSYANGVFLTNGQSKGAMLRALLAKAGRSFGAIVFSDDTAAHHQTMKAAFANQGVEGSFYRYGRMDPQVTAFLQGDKTQVVEQWEAFAAANSLNNAASGP